MDTVNTDLLRGRVDIIVLNALSEKDGYGYDILNYIQTRTQGHYEMKQSSIYSVLKRLEKLGQIRSYAGGNETNGAKRRYYSLTDSGKLILENEKKEWSYTRTLLDNLVSDDNFDLKNDIPPFKPSDLRPLTKRVSAGNEKADENEDEVSVENQVLTATQSVSPTQPTNNPLQKLDNNVIVANNDAIHNSFERHTNIIETFDDTNVVFAENKVNLAEEKAFTSQTEKHYNVNPPSIPVINHSEDKASHASAYARLFEEKPIEKPIEKEIVNETPVDFDKLYSSKPVKKQNLNLYKDVLGSIFKTETPRNKVEKQESFENIDCKYIYDLKSVLNNEGHHLKEYSPTANKSAIKYLSLNKLIRDSMFLSFLFFVVTILALYLTRSYFDISKTTLYIVGGLGIIVPIAGLIVFYQNPNKKKKDTVNLKLIINICFIVYLAAFMINLIFALIVPSEYSLNSLHIYAPCFMLLIIPFFSIIFALLYKSDKYHLN